MIFDFEPWQLDIDIDLTKQLYRSCKGDFVRVGVFTERYGESDEKNYNVTYRYPRGNKP